MNFHKLCDLKSHTFTVLEFWGWKSKVSLLGLMTRVGRTGSFWRPPRRLLALQLFIF